MNLQFREAGNVAELEALLRMRYEIYASDGELAQMVRDCDGYDVSYFDERALHFGAFSGNEPVAYLRMATNELTAFSDWVTEIAKAQSITLHRNGAQFPFENYSPDKTWNKNFISALGNKKIGEVGKLAIRKEYRKDGIVLERLIGAFLQYCRHNCFDAGFGSCTLPLERYYRKFGFARAGGAVPFTYPGLPPAVMVIFENKTENISQQIRR